MSTSQRAVAGLLLAIVMPSARAASFTPISGALKQIAVGSDGSVWGVNSSQQIYTYNFATTAWTNIPGGLVQIAVGSSAAVWGINFQQQIYHWNGSGWTNIPGALVQIAVGADGDVWGLNAASNIYHYNGQTQTFAQVTGQLAHIAVGSSGAVYGVNSGGSVYWYNPGTGSFQLLDSTVGFTQISVGSDGDLWAVSSSGAYHWDVLLNTMDLTSAIITQVAVGYGAAVWGLDGSGNVYQWNAQSATWLQVTGNLSNIAVGAGGAVWGLNSSQQIFELIGGSRRPFQFLAVLPGASLNQMSVGADGSVWGVNGDTVEYFNSGTQTFQAVPGAPPLSQVSVGAGANVWGVDANGNIYQYNASSQSWTHIAGELKLIQGGANGAVWGINASGSTYYYNFATSSWVNVPGQLGTLSVGADGTVWGINGFLQIYRFNGTSWVNVPGSLVQISVGNANNIWGVNAQNQVYQYNASTQSWVNIPGALLAEVRVAFDGSVWGVDGAGNLYQWNASTQSFNVVGGSVTDVFVGSASAVWAANVPNGVVYSWFGGLAGAMVTLNTPSPGATQLSGHAYNVDPNTTKIVIYALTNEWYVQPLANAPFTNISADGSWTSSTLGWSSLVVLLVNPANYTPAAMEITNPALDPGVLAYTMYPAGPVSLNFSGYTWGIKLSGNVAGDQFAPGPNFWSNDPSVVHVAADGVHLKPTLLNGTWQCGDIYVNQSLGYGTYTVQVSSNLAQLDQNIVASPLYIYVGPNQELDNEYSGSGGLITAPYNAQFVVQPFKVSGNLMPYVQPSTAQFTTQMDWQSDHVTFTVWNGWASAPASGTLISQWTYTGNNIPPAGQERARMTVWLYNGSAPLNGVGNEMVINSFSFQPASVSLAPPPPQQ